MLIAFFYLFTGWHRRINTKAGRADLCFYVLVPLLRGEAKVVDQQIRLVSHHLLTRLHRARYEKIHGKLFTIWDQYEDEEITTSQMLRKCSIVAGLAPTAPTDRIYDEEQ